METVGQTTARERKSRVLNFRVPPTVESQLLACLDPANGVTSADQAARKILLAALADREQERRLTALRVDNLLQSEIFTGDAEHVLREFPAKICRTCICSPPYWRQRDYHHPDQLGQERTPERYIDRLADAFDEVHRALANNGTLWVVIDDSYWKKQLVGVPWRLAFELQRRGWFWRAEIVWHKPCKPEPCKDRPTRAHDCQSSVLTCRAL
jgi:hypothetical protein